MDLQPGCFNCDLQATASLPPRLDVVHTEHWRVGHGFNSTLPGWLVLVPTRHMESFTELSPEAAHELGGLVRRLSIAMEQVTGCVKTYLMQFSEERGTPTCTSTWCLACRSIPRRPAGHGCSPT